VRGFFIFVFTFAIIMPDLEKIYRLFQKCGLVTTDSRNVPPGSMFFGLKGDLFDGNRFAPEAINKGAAYAIVDSAEIALNEKYILVENVLETLQALARHHRELSRAKVIAITGSNGKTTTKELTGAVLSIVFKTVMTRGNLNNHIGVPLTLLSIQGDTEIAILEMGANHPGEIAHLCHIGNPDYGIVTNIGKAHLEGFGGFQGVIKAKSELYNFLRNKNAPVFVNRDNALLWEITEGMERISFGASEGAGCRGEIAETDPFLVVRLHHAGTNQLIKTNLVGGYNFENVMAAVCIGENFNVPVQKAAMAIMNYLPENNRSQRVDTGQNILLMDAYNANPSSMKAALENFSKFTTGEKMVILGDMMELGSSSAAEHMEIIRLLDSLEVGRIILVGELFSKAASGTGMLCFPAMEAARKYLSEQNLRGKTVLVKGSRKMQLEKLLNCF
jgi:UDP-N-acetylmuramoyl-tripeptide--D-alanyl-D-alanine ligase